MCRPKHAFTVSLPPQKGSLLFDLGDESAMKEYLPECKKYFIQSK